MQMLDFRLAVSRISRRKGDEILVRMGAYKYRVFCNLTCDGGFYVYYEVPAEPLFVVRR